jgi:Zn-dependent protease
MVISNTMYWILFAIPSILIASTIHEYAHGFAAFKMGDPTAKAAGRLTLNPLAHIDPLGAIAMIVFRFGWSKPVPINEYNFRRRELGTAITALAGPFSNFLVVGICALSNSIFNIAPDTMGGSLLMTFTVINLALAFFNLLPIPPLDGHKIVRAILPKGLRYYWEQLEKFQIVLLVILIVPITQLGSIASIYMSFAISQSLLILGFL